MRLITTIALLTILSLSACVETNRPGGDVCTAEALTIDLALDEAGLTPNDPSVCRGQRVTLRVTSDADGVLHIHGYDEDVPATSVEAGETTELQFDASRSGQFPIELHTSEAPEGVTLGIFTVHEP